MKNPVAVIGLAMALTLGAQAQNYETNQYVRLYAGSQVAGFQNGTGALARFQIPSDMVADAGGTLYVWDQGNSSIRKVTPGGVVSTLPGVFISYEYGLQLGPDGYLWSLVSSGNQYQLLRISTNGGGVQSYAVSLPWTTGDVTYKPGGFCVDAAGKFYTFNAFQVVQFDQFGAVSVYAGSTNTQQVALPASTNTQPYSVYGDGNGTSAGFASSDGFLACDGTNVFVSDDGGRLIRIIDVNRNVSTFAGALGDARSVDGPVSSARFYDLDRLLPDGAGGLYGIEVASIAPSGEGPGVSSGTSIRHISGGVVSTVAGSFVGPDMFQFITGPSSQARFGSLVGLAVAGGTLYASDYWDNCVFAISTNVVSVGSPAVLQLARQGGQTQLMVTATVGSTYQINRSPDLVNWLAEDTLTISNNPSIWVDPQPAPGGTAFYRAILLQ